MKKSLTFFALAASVTACAGSYPVPTQRMADAQASHRSAQELGAANIPEAQLHLKLAEEQMAKANVAIKDDDNRRADFILVRAKSDADLALAIAREQKSKKEMQEMVEKANAQASANARAAAGAQGGSR